MVRGNPQTDKLAKMSAAVVNGAFQRVHRNKKSLNPELLKLRAHLAEAKPNIPADTYYALITITEQGLDGVFKYDHPEIRYQDVSSHIRTIISCLLTAVKVHDKELNGYRDIVDTRSITQSTAASSAGMTLQQAKDAGIFDNDNFNSQQEQEQESQQVDSENTPRTPATTSSQEEDDKFSEDELNVTNLRQLAVANAVAAGVSKNQANADIDELTGEFGSQCMSSM